MKLRPTFGSTLMLILAVYFGLSCLYIAHLPLVMDEFAGAEQVQRLAHEIPYRDFQPYKTVLGYYLELPLLAARSQAFAAIVTVKVGLAALVALALAWVGFALRPLFGGRATLLSLAALCFHSTFLERSSELRVDMLTSLAGLISLVLLLQNRPGQAGLWVAVSFLVSQKGAYFGLASGCAAVATLALSARQTPSQVQSELRAWLRFACGAAVPLAFYAGVVALLSSPQAMYGSTVGRAVAIAGSSAYHIDDFWRQTLDRNPVFYAATILALVYLAVRGLGASVRPQRTTELERRHLLLAAYGAAVAFVGIWHKQPWPYFFVLLLPTAMVVLAAATQTLLEFVGSARLRSPLLLAVGAVALVAVPLGSRVPIALARTHAAQLRTVTAAEAFLGGKRRYLAGVPMAFRDPQTAGLEWLDEVRLAELAAEPQVPGELLRRSPPSLIINSHRLRYLPEAFLTSLNDDYFPVGANLYPYAPQAGTDGGGPRTLELAFSGLYRIVLGTGTSEATINGVRRAAGAVIPLPAGPVVVRAPRGARLMLWSEEPAFLAAVNAPHAELFYNVYTY